MNIKWRLNYMLANSYGLKKSPIFDREKALNYIDKGLAAIKKLRAENPRALGLQNLEKVYKELKKNIN